ncbi:MAG: DUF4097 domain-containing protein [Clostridioides sp.]|jgi:DUF4097 and DUF4098 domain-containing protein YvlB|nr:DUF4097 domain-containing protein [Clostridioides sp.]
MKNIDTKTRILCLVVVILVLISLIAHGMIGKNSYKAPIFGRKPAISFFSGNHEETNGNGMLSKYLKNSEPFANSKTYKYSVKDIDKLSVDANLADISVKISDSDEIVVLERTSAKFSSSKYTQKLTYTKNGGTLRLEDRGKNDWSLSKNLNARLPRRELEIAIPKGYTGKLSIDTAFGDISVNSDLSLEDIKFATELGNINVDSKLKSKKLKLEANAGDIDTNQFEAGSYDIATDMGNISISASRGHGKIETSMGDIEAKLGGIDGRVNVSTSMGDADVQIARGLKLNVETDISMGDNDVNVSLDVDSNNELKVESSMGDVSVNYLD